MNLGAGRTVFVVCLLLIILASVNVAVADVAEFQVDSTDIQVYRDGLVRVTQSLSVNETVPVVTLPLLSSSVDNFIVLDENQTVLDYEVDLNTLTVFTLGAQTVSVQYDTHSLTSKDAEVWTFIVDSPDNVTVLLPEASTIVYLSGAPNSIDSQGNQIMLSLFPDQWEISYVFPLTPPADFQVSNLEVTPADAKAGETVTVSVKIANIGGQKGSYAVSLLVNQTVEATRTVTLEKDASTTEEFTVIQQTPGKYTVEIAGLVDQFTVAESSQPSDGTDSDTFPVELIIVAVVAAVAVAVFVVLLLFRRRGPNVEKIFRMYPRLNAEEKDVIQFLADNEGKAFESQVREKFPDIPRTSLWRLVKRLEKLEIIKVKKIGLENQVELKK